MSGSPPGERSTALALSSPIRRTSTSGQQVPGSWSGRRFGISCSPHMRPQHAQPACWTAWRSTSSGWQRTFRATGGATLAESLSAVLGDVIGWGPAQEVVRQAVARAAASDRSLRDELLDHDAVRGAVSTTMIDDALDPERYLGMAGALVDRALAAVAPVDSEVTP